MQAGTVTAACVGGDEQPLGLTVDGPSHRVPPAPDGRHRELCRVVIDADAHPAGVLAEVVNTVWDGSPQFGDQEVVDLDLLRISLRPPFPAAILEVSDQLLL